MSYRDWIISTLKSDAGSPEIDQVVGVGESLIEITTKRGKIIIVGIVDKPEIFETNVYEVFTNAEETPDIIISKSAAIWNGSAINYLQRHRIGWGGIGTINSALHTNDYGSIQKSEFKFVEENLKTHTRVSRLERVYDRVFKIYRTGSLKPITIALINSYELSAEEVRNAIRKYGKFDAILKTNPNGNPTANAYSAAAEIGADIFSWRQLLGRLNKR